MNHPDYLFAIARDRQRELIASGRGVAPPPTSQTKDVTRHCGASRRRLAALGQSVHAPHAAALRRP